MYDCLLKNIRCIALFAESIKSKYTARNYNSHLKQFLNYMKVSSADALLLYGTSELQQKLEDYAIHLKQTINPNSVPSKFQGIKHFCIMNEIPLNWNKTYKLFPQKQKTQTLRAYTTSEIHDVLNAESSIRNKALIHFLASTGARVGVFDHLLSMKHMKKMPKGCSAILLYAGDIDEYYSFLTPQATEILATYHDLRKQKGEKFCDETPIFGVDGAIQKQLKWNSVRSIIYRSLQKSRVIRYKQDTRYNIQINHGFRKRFNTVLKLENNMNYNIAEKLMGHKNGLDGVYFTPTLDELFAEFKKVIPQLEI